MTAPTRPVLRWHGGKWKLAPWIISHFPRHRVYVEPFGGAASVLLRKPVSHGEVYNDLDDDVTNLFNVLRDGERSERLLGLLRLTPFSETEFRASCRLSDEPVERARKLIVRSYMGFGSNAHASEDNGRAMTGYRGNSNRSGTTPAHDWVNYPDCLRAIIDRIQGVTVYCRDGTQVMEQHDSDVTLHYVDPPYLPDLRAAFKTNGGMRGLYRHELDAEGHARLLVALRSLAGMVVLSGYPSPIYDDALGGGWRRVETPAYADGARPRIEVLWLNPACAAALDRHHAGAGMPLFRAADA